LAVISTADHERVPCVEIDGRVVAAEADAHRVLIAAELRLAVEVGDGVGERLPAGRRAGDLAPEPRKPRSKVPSANRVGLEVIAHLDPRVGLAVRGVE